MSLPLATDRWHRLHQDRRDADLSTKGVFSLISHLWKASRCDPLWCSWTWGRRGCSGRCLSPPWWRTWSFPGEGCPPFLSSHISAGERKHIWNFFKLSKRRWRRRLALHDFKVDIWAAIWGCKNKQTDERTVIYLNNAVDVEAHHKLRDVAHQIVEPVVDSRQNVDWFVVVSEKNTHAHTLTFRQNRISEYLPISVKDFKIFKFLLHLPRSHFCNY